MARRRAGGGVRERSARGSATAPRPPIRRLFPAAAGELRRGPPALCQGIDRPFAHRRPPLLPSGPPGLLLVAPPRQRPGGGPAPRRRRPAGGFRRLEALGGGLQESIPPVSCATGSAWEWWPWGKIPSRRCATCSLSPESRWQALERLWEALGQANEHRCSGSGEPKGLRFWLTRRFFRKGGG
ncbi:protein of unknown function [Methylacidimicrobium sp. AP8]|nr:protein of unknown function [Methylacidimicrobium sp. AP8]